MINVNISLHFILKKEDRDVFANNSKIHFELNSDIVPSAGDYIRSELFSDIINNAEESLKNIVMSYGLSWCVDSVSWGYDDDGSIIPFLVLRGK